MEIMQYVASWSLLYNWLLSNRNSAIKPYKLCFHLFRLGIWERDALQAGYRISLSVLFYFLFFFLSIFFKGEAEETLCECRNGGLESMPAGAYAGSDCNVTPTRIAMKRSIWGHSGQRRGRMSFPKRACKHVTICDGFDHTVVVFTVRPSFWSHLL